MIVVKLQGGLGNQLFQWAYAKYLSQKYTIDFGFDLSFFSYQMGVTTRNFDLDKFPNLILPKNNIRPNTFVTFLDNFTFSEFQYDPKYNYYLDGFWQSEKYFNEISSIIKSELQPDSQKLSELSKKISKNSISLHVRRTDYLTYSNFHPIQSIDYYTEAINIIGDYSNIYVFSDDIEWCKNNLKFKNIVFVENQSNIKDLWLMSLCDHNIIANSTFSWWGAWLNNNKNKIVVAPKLWFGSRANLRSDDIIPENWIKI